MSSVHFSSKTVDWSTPQALFEKLNSGYHFTIDVAASAENAKVPRYYDEKTNGLLQNWDGEMVWCNPPYGRTISDWVKKASESNANTVMLLPARTDTRWFHEYIYNKASVQFLKGRLKFGNSKHNAPFPSMLVIFLNNLQDEKLWD